MNHKQIAEACRNDERNNMPISIKNRCSLLVMRVSKNYKQVKRIMLTKIRIKK